MICSPVMDLHQIPCLYLKSEHEKKTRESSDNEDIAISCTKMHLNVNTDQLVAKTITSTFVITTDDKGMFDVLDTERALKEVGNVFAYMRSLITKTNERNNNELPVLSPQEYLELRCDAPQILDMALLALATGRNTINKSLYLSKERHDHQKFYLATIVSSDILLRCLCPSPGFFQLMFGDLLQRQQIT